MVANFPHKILLKSHENFGRSTYVASGITSLYTALF